MPAGTLIMDLAGKSVIPGLVMVHEHLHYPTGPGVSGNLTQSFSRLYLAGGVTSMRTASNMNGIGEIKLKQAIDAGAQAGPWIDATAPYLEGRPGIGLGQVYEIEDAAAPMGEFRDGAFVPVRAGRGLWAERERLEQEYEQDFAAL